MDSHPFRFMSIGHMISEVWPFQNLSLKIQSQDRSRGQRPRSHSPASGRFILTSIYLHQSDHQFVTYSGIHRQGRGDGNELKTFRHTRPVWPDIVESISFGRSWYELRRYIYRVMAIYLAKHILQTFDLFYLILMNRLHRIFSLRFSPFSDRE